MAELDLHLDCPGLVVEEGFHRLFQVYAAELELGEGCLVEVVLAGDEAIGRIHEESHGDPSPTDCVAFPTGFPELGPGVGLLGAFYMGVEEVARNGAAEGHGFDREVAFVLAHGLLHLLGYEDGTPEERAAMFRRQEELLKSFLAAEGALPSLLTLSGAT